MSELALVFGAAALISVVVTFGIRGLARRLRIVSPLNPIIVQHATPVAYLGGLAILLTVTTLYLVQPASVFVLRPYVMLPAVLYVLLGIADDLLVFSPGHKFSLQALVAVIGAAAYTLTSSSSAAAWQIALAIFWILTMVNVVNIMDVSDGLVGGLCVIAFAALAVLDPALGLSGAAVAGACAGFLLFNRPPATIFLGDAGSNLLGFWAAAFVLEIHDPARGWSHLAAPALIFSLFFFEFAFVSAVRIRKGIPPWKGSPDHFALRLRKAGFRRIEVAAIAWTIAASLAALALLWHRLGDTTRLATTACLLLGAILGARYLLAFDVRSSSLADEAA